jgi:hypothetical protein
LLPKRFFESLEISAEVIWLLGLKAMEQPNTRIPPFGCYLKNEFGYLFSGMVRLPAIAE